MILNFLRVAECPLEYMVSSSYSEYHSQKANARDIIATSKLRSTIESVSQTVQSFSTPELRTYFADCSTFWNSIHTIQQLLLGNDKTSHRLLDDLFQCGRIVYIRDVYEIDLPAIILDGSFSTTGKNLNHQRLISVLVLNRDTNRSLTDIDRLILKENENLFILPLQQQTNAKNDKHLYQIKTIHLNDIIDITNEIVPNLSYHKILEHHWNYRTNETYDIELDSTFGQDKTLRQAIEHLKAFQQKSSNKFERFTLVKDFLNKNSQFDLLNKLHQLNNKLIDQTFDNVHEHFHHLRKLNFYESKLTRMNERLSSLQSNLQSSAEYESMLEVLKQLRYISKTNILKLKGQVAAQFGSGKELLLTELVFQNLIDNLTPSEIAALVSAIVFQGKRFDEQAQTIEQRKEMTPALHKAKQDLSRQTKKKKLEYENIFFDLVSIAIELDKIQRDYKIPTNIEEELNFSIMSLVYKWAQGAKFYEIMNDPDLEVVDLQEGTIVRTIMRIEELCSDIRNAGKIVGNSELVDKLNQVTTLIKRGIVFAPSLYFSDTISTL